MIPKCLSNTIQNLLQNFTFCKFGRHRKETTDEEAENNNDENRNERARITTKEANTNVKIDKTNNNNNNNYNSIRNVDDESDVKMEFDQKLRKGGGRKRRGSTKIEDDKFIVIKRTEKKDRVSMLRIFRNNSLRNSVKEATIEEEEGGGGGEGEGKEEEGDVQEEQQQPENGEDGEKIKIMDGAEFRLRGKEMVDYIVDYLDSVGSKRVTPEVKPGYLRPLLPSEAPQEPEPWDNIMQDVEKKIMPGVLHWNHPHFFAYFASGNSYPTILADMLSDALSMMGFSWASGPVCTELEIIMLDWYGKAIGLPKEFISTTPGSKGGGVIQGSASECILVTMLAARHHALQYLREQEAIQKRNNRTSTENGVLEEEEEDEEEDEEEEDETGAQSRLLHKLVVYCCREAHSCVEKAAKICLVKIRVLEPDEKGALRGETLRQAMEQDRALGLIPFFVSCIIGSTASCTFDNLEEIGAVCRNQELPPTSYSHRQATRTKSWNKSQEIKSKSCNQSQVNGVNSLSQVDETDYQSQESGVNCRSQTNGPLVNGTDYQSQESGVNCKSQTNGPLVNGTDYQSQESGVNCRSQTNGPLVNGTDYQSRESRVNRTIHGQKTGPPVWMHVDCAYAGSAFLCPELRPLMAGIEYADSVNTNPNKWMLTCFDCSCMWVKDKLRLTRGMVVDPIYLKHDYDDELIDFRHWQIPLSRRFRSLKLFFLFRSYGIAGLQQYIRNHIQLAKYFETLVRKDTRFEVVNEVKMGLVCFRLKGPDLWTQELLAKINASGRIHMIPGVRRKRYFIRFAVTYEHAQEEHIRYAWKVIGHYADTVLEKMTTPPPAAALGTSPRPRLSSRQHSFTRGVSRDVYKARSTSLYDGVSPIPVVNDDNDDDDLNNNVFEEAFAAKSV